jgi:hypothetical protein
MAHLTRIFISYTTVYNTILVISDERNLVQSVKIKSPCVSEPHRYVTYFEQHKGSCTFFCNLHFDNCEQSVLIFFHPFPFVVRSHSRPSSYICRHSYQSLIMLRNGLRPERKNSRILSLITDSASISSSSSDIQASSSWSVV